jgi:hypothetical protein
MAKRSRRIREAPAEQLLVEEALRSDVILEYEKVREDMRLETSFLFVRHGPGQYARTDLGRIENW